MWGKAAVPVALTHEGKQPVTLSRTPACSLTMRNGSEFAVAILEAEPPVPSKGPFDASVVAPQTSDVLADALLKEGCQGTS